MPCPVTTMYTKPRERVLLWPLRDANPFFHLFESLWMLGGRNDLAYVKQFAKNMQSYSDDGHTMWGAYGWRWRSFFQVDQLAWAIRRLKKNPLDRRVVIQMWSAELDTVVADNNGKDVPCNVTLHFQVMNGVLNMTVWNRSNDIIWGAYGANAVHFSILQEYVSGMTGIPMGRYWQVSDNYHAYTDLYHKRVGEAEKCRIFDPYAYAGCEVQDLVKDANTWDEDLSMFLEDPSAVGFRNTFFRRVAKPMFMAHKAYKQEIGWDKISAARQIIGQMPDKNDWKLAATSWLDNRQRKFLKEADDGPVQS